MVPVQIPVAPGRWLAAMHHRPARASTGRGVLIINPLGQEAVRAHRLLRVLSDRLARQGVHVLRFDCHGCGDSSGDDLDGEMNGWVGDVLTAHGWLCQQAGVTGVTWLGIRLGFALGWLAASRLDAPDGDGSVRAVPTTGADAVQGCVEAAPAPMGGGTGAGVMPPDRLVGWDPVAVGSAYLARLWADHQAAIRRAFSLPTVPDRLLRRQQTEQDLSEAMGFALSPVLIDQIRALDRQDWHRVPVRSVKILLSNDALPWPHAHRDSPVSAALRVEGANTLAARIELASVDVDFDWTSEEALNTPLVPDQALKQLLPWLSEEPDHV